MLATTITCLPLRSRRAPDLAPRRRRPFRAPRSRRPRGPRGRRAGRFGDSRPRSWPRSRPLPCTTVTSADAAVSRLDVDGVSYLMSGRPCSASAPKAGSSASSSPRRTISARSKRRSAGSSRRRAARARGAGRGGTDAARDATRPRTPDRRDHASAEFRLHAVRQRRRDVSRRAGCLAEPGAGQDRAPCARQVRAARPGPRALRRPSRAHARGRATDVTLLFSDIAGFTTFAEALAPDDLAIALGAYLEAMTRRSMPPAASSTSTPATGSWRSGTRRGPSTTMPCAPVRRRSPASPQPTCFHEPRLGRPRSLAHALRHPSRRGDRRPLRRARPHELHGHGRRGEPRARLEGLGKQYGVPSW